MYINRYLIKIYILSFSQVQQIIFLNTTRKKIITVKFFKTMLAIYLQIFGQYTLRKANSWEKNYTMKENIKTQKYVN